MLMLNGEIVVNGVSMQVTYNLEATLASTPGLLSASSRAFRVWADAICFNQSDIVERSKQVGKMREKTNTFQRVHIFLFLEFESRR